MSFDDHSPQSSNRAAARRLPLAGQVALVTGASRGLGRAVAGLLAALGADLCLVGRDSEGLRQTEARMAPRAQVLALPGDLADPALPAQLVRTAEDALGRIDILINNAAAIEPLARAEQADPEAWTRTIAVNLIAPFRLMRAVLPGMLSRGHGRIVNLSSAAAREPAHHAARRMPPARPRWSRSHAISRRSWHRAACMWLSCDLGH